MTHYSDWTWSVVVTAPEGQQQRPVKESPARFGELRLPVTMGFDDNQCRSLIFDNATGATVASQEPVLCQIPKQAETKIGGTVGRAIGLSQGFKK